MNNLSDLQTSLIKLLNIEFPDIQIDSQYPSFSSPIPKGKHFIAVSLKKMEESMDLSKQQMNITVYVPFADGSRQCLSYMDKIIQFTKQAGLENYYGITVNEVKYDSTYKYFYMTMTVIIKSTSGQTSVDEEEESQTVYFDGTELTCLSKNIKIVCSRQLGKKFSPLVGEIIQDLGIKSRVITCTCSLSSTLYQNIYLIFTDGEKKILKIPHNENINAILTTMTTNYISNDLIKCQLIFTEVSV